MDFEMGSADGVLLVLMGEGGQLHGVEGVTAVPYVLVNVVHAGTLAEFGARKNMKMVIKLSTCVQG